MEISKHKSFDKIVQDVRKSRENRLYGEDDNMRIQPIEKKQMHEIVYEQIKGGILDGDFAPGEKLNQDELAGELGVSRMPVRDALKRLANDGLIENNIHKGFVVTKFSKETLTDVLYVRSLLESEAILLAENTFTDENVRNLEEIHRQSEIETENGNLVKIMELNRKFHFALYQAITSKLLLEHIERLWDRFPNYAMYTKLENAKNSLRTHRRIIEFIKTSNFIEAAAEMKKHILKTEESLNYLTDDTLSSGD